MNAQESVPATSLGLVPEASGTASLAALAAVKTALQRRMIQSLQTGLASMGYSFGSGSRAASQ